MVLVSLIEGLILIILNVKILMILFNSANIFYLPYAKVEGSI